ncbi:MAG: TRAP transporter small permease, partial [Alphaproteobacteria bacterium]
MGAARLAALDRAAGALAYLGGAILVLIAVFMTVDVALRALGAPLFGARDLVQYGLVLVVFAGIAHCGRTGGHVAVDLFFTRMGPRTAFAADLLMKLVSLAVLALLAWRLGLRAWTADAGEASNLLQIPRWPFYAFASGGTALYVILLACEIALLVARGSRTAPNETRSGPGTGPR